MHAVHALPIPASIHFHPPFQEADSAAPDAADRADAAPSRHPCADTATAPADDSSLPAGTPDRRQALCARLAAAFIDHARATVTMPGDADDAAVIRAFLAPHAGTDQRWLENDSRLMCRLATVSGLFAGEPAATDLRAGHRRLLADALALALARDVDWRKTLDSDTHHAGNLSIKDTAAALDARILQALHGAGLAPCLAAIVPQLRQALADDPTLSLIPLPRTIRHGSREWQMLRAGMQDAIAIGLDPATLASDEITGLADAMADAASRGTTAIGALELATVLAGTYPRLAAEIRARAAACMPSGMPPMRLALPVRPACEDSRWSCESVSRPGIQDVHPHFVKAIRDDGGTQWLRRIGNGYACFDPYGLEAVGAVLLAGDGGRLFPSLDVAELAGRAVTDPAMLEHLRRTPAGDDGGIALDGRIFARIAGVYIEIAPAMDQRMAAAPAYTMDRSGGRRWDSGGSLVHDAAQGGWVLPHSSGNEAGSLAPMLQRWTLAVQPDTLPWTQAAAAIRQGALCVYGDRYADFLRHRDADRYAIGMDDPVDAAATLLGDGRFLHAMLALAPAHAGRIVQVLDMCRRRAGADSGGHPTMPRSRQLVARYFDDALQALDSTAIVQLRDVLDAHGGRVMALLRLARSGNGAQQQRTDEIEQMARALMRAVAAKSIEEENSLTAATPRRTDGRTPSAMKPRVPPERRGNATAALTPDEHLALEALGLTPMPIPQATVDETLAILRRVQEIDDKDTTVPRGVQERNDNGDTVPRPARETRDDRASVLARLAAPLRKLAPANTPATRLLFRALLCDKRLCVNGLSLAALAGRYAIDADDVAAYIHAAPGEHRSISSLPLSGLGWAGIAAYRTAPPPQAVLLPGELPLFRATQGSAHFIHQGGDWFQVRWDGDNASWRVIHPDKANAPAIPVRRGRRGWQVHGAVGVPGGGPALRRRVDLDAASEGDVDIPPRIKCGRIPYQDRLGLYHAPQGKIWQTETVALASRILELTTDVTARVPWQDAFPEYFDLMVDNNGRACLVRPNPHLADAGDELGLYQNVYRETKAFFQALTGSATFQGLLNRAIAEGRLGSTSNARWTLQVALPGAAQAQNGPAAGRYPVDHRQRVVTLPHLRGPADKPPFHISTAGRLIPLTPRRTAVCNYVAMLTGEATPSLVPWLQGGRIDPKTFKTAGLGERGPLHYLAERIMREIASPMMPLLSHLPVDDALGYYAGTMRASTDNDDVVVLFQWNDMTMQAIEDGGGFAALERYVKLQDDYLARVFPVDGADIAPLSPRMPDIVLTPAATAVDTASVSVSTASSPPTASSTQVSTPAPDTPTTSTAKTSTFIPAAGAAAAPSPVPFRPNRDSVLLQELNVPVPYPYSNTSTRADRSPLIAETETVVDTCRILDWHMAPAAYALRSLNFEELFSIAPIDAPLPAPPVHGPAHTYNGRAAENLLRTLYFSLEWRSPTFQDLLRRARVLGHVGNEERTRWTIRLVLPGSQATNEQGAVDFGTETFAVDLANRTLRVPPPSDLRIANRIHLSTSGDLLPMRTDRIFVRNLVQALARIHGSDLGRWGPPGAPAAKKIKSFGLGERGAIEFLTDRILRELGMEADFHLSPIYFDSAARAGTQDMKSAIAAAGGPQTLKLYIEAQNRYLEARHGKRDAAPPHVPVPMLVPVMASLASIQHTPATVPLLAPIPRLVPIPGVTKANKAEPLNFLRCETVRDAMLLLEAAPNVAVDPSWARDFDQRFTISVSDLRLSYLAAEFPELTTEAGQLGLHSTISPRLRHSLMHLYDHSETFRRLANRMMDRSRAADGDEPGRGQWRLQVVLPVRVDNALAVYESPPTVNLEERRVDIPIPKPEHIQGEYYLSRSGTVYARQTPRVTAENLVRMLTHDIAPPQPHAAMTDGAIDPRTLGERTGIGYIVERICAEMALIDKDWELPPRLSAVPFSARQIDAAGRDGNDLSHGRLNAETMQAINAVGGLDALERYCRKQDFHLESIHPVRRPPAAAPMQQPAADADGYPPAPAARRRRHADRADTAADAPAARRERQDDRPAGTAFAARSLRIHSAFFPASDARLSDAEAAGVFMQKEPAMKQQNSQQNQQNQQGQQGQRQQSQEGQGGQQHNQNQQRSQQQQQQNRPNQQQGQQRQGSDQKR